MPRRISVLVAILSALVLLLSAGLATAAASHPGAHIFSTQLTGEAEEPGPGDPDGSGTAHVLVVPAANLVCYRLTWQNLEAPVWGAHIHVGTEDTSGGVVVPLFMGMFAGTGSYQSCTRDADADAIAANPENYYVNIHTDEFPAGAIRGQLG